MHNIQNSIPLLIVILLAHISTIEASIFPPQIPHIINTSSSSLTLKAFSIRGGGSSSDESTSLSDEKEKPIHELNIERKDDAESHEILKEKSESRSDKDYDADATAIKVKKKKKKSKSKKRRLAESEVSSCASSDNIIEPHSQSNMEESLEASVAGTKIEGKQKQKSTKSTSLSTSKNKKNRNKQSSSTSSSQSNSKPRGGGGKDGECLRRIKREWKDAVKMGIGYDWKTMQTVTIHGRYRSSNEHGSNHDHIHNNNHNGDSSNSSSNAKSKPITHEEFYKYNHVRIGPYGSNLLRWHFSVRGPANSCYSDGVYHGRILLPKNYPMSPPRVQMLTPSGRFVPGFDICLSASAYHPETWTPRWTVLSLVDALRIHMLTTSNEIGGMEKSNEERLRLASESRYWRAGAGGGLIDHGRMISCGLFCDISTSGVDGDDNENANENANNVEHENNGNDNDDDHDEEFDLLLREITNKAMKDSSSVKQRRKQSKSKRGSRNKHCDERVRREYEDNEHRGFTRVQVPSQAQARKRTIGELIIVGTIRTIISLLKSPLRLGVLFLLLSYLR